MTAKTAAKTAMSTRKPHAQRVPAGRRRVGGCGSGLLGSGAGEGTRVSGLRERQLAARGVVVKNLRVASPLDGSFELASCFIFAEVFVEQVLEKFGGERAIGFGLERLFHLSKNRNVDERRLTEDGLA